MSEAVQRSSRDEGPSDPRGQLKRLKKGDPFAMYDIGVRTLDGELFEGDRAIAFLLLSFAQKRGLVIPPDVFREITLDVSEEQQHEWLALYHLFMRPTMRSGG